MVVNITSAATMNESARDSVSSTPAAASLRLNVFNLQPISALHSFETRSSLWLTADGHQLEWTVNSIEPGAMFVALQSLRTSKGCFVENEPQALVLVASNTDREVTLCCIDRHGSTLVVSGDIAGGSLEPAGDIVNNKDMTLLRFYLSDRFSAPIHGETVQNFKYFDQSLRIERIAKAMESLNSGKALGHTGPSPARQCWVIIDSID